MSKEYECIHGVMIDQPCGKCMQEASGILENLPSEQRFEQPSGIYMQQTLKDLARIYAKHSMSLKDVGEKDMADKTEFDKVKSSGAEEKFMTGAKRDVQTGKGRYDLLPAYAIHRLARHFENGAERYEADNWRKGIPLRRYLCSAQSHLEKLMVGMNDEDHAAACAWNIMCFIETQKAIQEGILPQELDNLTEIQKLMPKVW